MIRCKIEMIPHGDESKARTIGLIEIANDGTGTRETGNYKIILRKTFPWQGALKQQWRVALLGKTQDDDEIMNGSIEGFRRIQRGPYDLLYRALKACGLDKRNA